MARPLTWTVNDFAAPDRRSIARAPSALQRGLNHGFLWLCRGFAWASALLVASIIFEIVAQAMPAVRQRGFGFLTGTTWDPNQDAYSILPEIWGTLFSSVLALILGTAFGVAAAIFLSEGFLGQGAFKILKFLKLQHKPFLRAVPDHADQVLRNMIELLAAIPSVVYGLWGIFVIIPAIRPGANWMNEHFDFIPFFSTPLSGPGVFPAVIVLAVMIMPTITALSRDALVAVPEKLRMAAYGLGATRLEAIAAVALPTAGRGIFGAVVIAFGRALGETMALAMLVGNANRISLSLFSPANTLAALLANSFPEAGPAQVPVLMYAALVLLAITLLVNIAGSLLLLRANRAGGDAR
jgi:phosphate transport system permease protein